MRVLPGKDPTMDFFDSEISQARALFAELCRKHTYKTWRGTSGYLWPKDSCNRPILAADTAVELGPPHLPSVLSILPSGQESGIQDETITLVGPDIKELDGQEAPMAKVLFVELTGATEENLYDLYLKVALARLDISLRGYMVRASSQIQREWCRVNREAVQSGISLAHIGAAEIETVKGLPFVKAAEMGVVTLSASSVASFSGLARKAERIASALCKLSREMDHECESCAFSDLCGSLSGLKHLRAMRRKGKKETG